MDDLLEAAGEVFSQKGFHGSSMEDIARAAQYATGALYRYFPSKEVLYLGLMEKRSLELIREVKQRAGDIDDPVAALREIISAQIDVARRDLTLLQIFFGEKLEAAKNPKDWDRLDALHQDFHRWLAEKIADGQARGIFQPGDSRLYTTAIQGMLMALFRSWANGWGDVADSAHQKEFLIEYSLRAICKHPNSAP